MAFTLIHLLSREAAKTADELKSIQFYIDAQKYGTIASLLVVLLDQGDTITQEVKLVWCAPLSVEKVIFLFARYFGLFVQVTNLAASILLTTDNNTTNGTCSYWHISLFASTLFIYVLSSVSLTMTIYDLQNRCTTVKRFLVGLHTSQVAGACICGYFILRPNVSYTPNCDIHNIAFPLIMFGLIGGLLELKFFIWGYLICRKALLRSGSSMHWWRTIMVVFGDGTWAWLTHITYIIICSNYAFYRQHTQPHLLYSWPITIHIIAACRMLLHRMNPATAQLIEKTKHFESCDTEMQHPAQISSNDASERSTRSRIRAQEASRGAPSVEPNVSAHSRGGSSAAGSDAIQVVPRSVLSTSNSMICESDEGDDSDAAEFTIEEGNYASSFETTSSDIEIGSEHTNTSMSSGEQREIWNNVFGDRS